MHRRGQITHIAIPLVLFGTSVYTLVVPQASAEEYLNRCEDMAEDFVYMSELLQTSKN